ncbi:unnamed protein product [Brassica rapa]|uniref:Uncharacterized protein n=1 Tax=Brassica campestris TaxID=3711 RepID=A0A3P6AJE9_BRACM|nr:unnamed protein product [Brassica rapa]VDC85330.1 unnamed protein product [Brassica rapa]
MCKVGQLSLAVSWLGNRVVALIPSLTTLFMRYANMVWLTRLMDFVKL